MATKQKWDVFEHDGVVYRGYHGEHRVQDVQMPGGEWRPYGGRDRIAPAMFGDFIRTYEDGEDGERPSVITLAQSRLNQLHRPKAPKGSRATRAHGLGKWVRSR
jgi:hypothetical protein